MTDILVRLVDLVYELLDADIVLSRICQALVERTLQGGIVFLCLGELVFEACHASAACSELLLGILIVLCQLLILVLTVLKVFLAGTATQHETANSKCHS